MMKFLTKLFTQSSCSQAKEANTELKRQVCESLDDSQRRVEAIKIQAAEQRRASPTPRIHVA